jgi:hypothetical protein
MQFESAAEAKVEYTAMLLGATGNVGGYILHLLVQRLGMTRVRASSQNEYSHGCEFRFSTG